MLLLGNRLAPNTNSLLMNAIMTLGFSNNW